MSAKGPSYDFLERMKSHFDSIENLAVVVLVCTHSSCTDGNLVHMEHEGQMIHASPREVRGWVRCIS